MKVYEARCHHAPGCIDDLVEAPAVGRPDIAIHIAVHEHEIDRLVARLARIQNAAISVLVAADA